MSQKLAVNGFKWVKQQNNQNLIKTSLKNMMKIVIRDIFLK